MLQGQINVGDTYVWEPNDPNAYELVVVTAIRSSSHGSQIQSTGVKGKFWNDETRFREACTRQKTKVAPDVDRIKGKFQTVEIK